MVQNTNKLISPSSPVGFRTHGLELKLKSKLAYRPWG